MQRSLAEKLHMAFRDVGFWVAVAITALLIAFWIFLGLIAETALIGLGAALFHCPVLWFLWRVTWGFYDV